MSNADATDEVIAEISRCAGDAEAQVRPVYLTNRTLAFVHDVGLTALGASGTVLAGLQSSAEPGNQYGFKVSILIVTAAVTVFAACNQFFKFKSRADACHLALSNIYDVRDKLALIAADKSKSLSLTAEQATTLREAVQKGIKDADLPQNWPIWRWWPLRRAAS